MPRTTTGRRTFRLRQLRPATISARNRGGDEKQEARVDDGSRKLAGEDRERHGDAPGRPHDHQDQERKALQRQPTGPIGNRSQQKSGNDGGQIAEQHLVDVPIARGESRRQRQLAVKKRQPDEHRQGGIQRTEQEKRAEAVTQDRRSGVILTQPRNGAHRGTVSFRWDIGAVVNDRRRARPCPRKFQRSALPRPGECRRARARRATARDRRGCSCPAPRA